MELAKQLDLLDKNEFRFVWITEFPQFEWSDEQGRYLAMHHPFTMPMEEDLPLLDAGELGKIRAKAYDMFSTEMRSAAEASESTRTTYRKKCLRRLDLRKNRHTASSASCLKHLSMEYRLTQDLHTVWTVLLCLWQSRTASVT